MQIIRGPRETARHAGGEEAEDLAKGAEGADAVRDRGGIDQTGIKVPAHRVGAGTGTRGVSFERIVAAMPNVASKLRGFPSLMSI